MYKAVITKIFLNIHIMEKIYFSTKERIKMINESDKVRAVQAFKLREERRKENVQLTKFLLGLAAAEFFVILAFFVR